MARWGRKGRARKKEDKMSCARARGRGGASVVVAAEEQVEEAARGGATAIPELRSTKYADKPRS